MNALQTYLKNPLYWLLVCVPLTLVAELLHLGEVVIFLVSVLGIVPLAKLIGDATEELALHVGPRLGGFLNATLGNAAELIITIVALRAGLIELVKASITGSILGNLLLIMGLAIVLGGLRHGVQTFDRVNAGLAATQMTLAIIALAIPTFFARAITANGGGHDTVEALSVGVAITMLVVYAFSVIFTFRRERTELPILDPPHRHEPKWSKRTALVVLGLSTVAIAWLSEVLVGAVEPTVEALGLSEFFVGIIIIPIVGNAAEHLVAVTMAQQNKMELSMSIALGSSMQIALLVAPLLVLLSLFIAPEPMDLVFNPFELEALGAATLIAAFVALDGESNWMEGIQLLAVFIILAIGFFFLPF
nr:calcium/proton exchanger [Ardenticatena sp.]